jgi:hypothetical protein
LIAHPFLDQVPLFPLHLQGMTDFGSLSVGCLGVASPMRRQMSNGDFNNKGILFQSSVGSIVLLRLQETAYFRIG